MIMKKTVSVFSCFLILFLQASFAQGLIRGTVRDEKGALQGVTVLVKHSSRGTQTDASGNFSIQASEADTLVFSFTGYAQQEIVVGNRSELSVTLGTDAKTLEDVVVVGYGTRRKQFLTGAVSTVGAEVF